MGKYKIGDRVTLTSFESVIMNGSVTNPIIRPYRSDAFAYLGKTGEITGSDSDTLYRVKFPGPFLVDAYRDKTPIRWLDESWIEAAAPLPTPCWWLSSKTNVSSPERR